MAIRYLAHYGVKGMKWGVRQDGKPQGYSYAKSGGVIKKGSKVLRVSTSQEDKTYGNKKHVSITMDDHKKWQKYLSDGYTRSGKQAYDIVYETTNDIKVAPASEVGKVFAEKFLDNPKKYNTTVKDIQDTYTIMQNNGWKITEDYLKYPDLMATVNVAYQTKTGKEFIDAMMKKGYGAISDTHGLNTSKDPLIILGPDKNLRKTYIAKYK